MQTKAMAPLLQNYRSFANGFDPVRPTSVHGTEGTEPAIDADECLLIEV
jgi:hypothetical protein